MIAFVMTGVVAGIVGCVKGRWKPTSAFQTFIDGMIELINVPFILVCAWSLGSVVSAMNTGDFMAGVVEQYLTPGLVPGLIFLAGALISFATGSSWGTWSLLMPIAFPMAVHRRMCNFIRSVRRPVLTYFGYDYPVVHRCKLQPHSTRYDSDTLRCDSRNFSIHRLPVRRSDRSVRTEYRRYFRSSSGGSHRTEASSQKDEGCRYCGCIIIITNNPDDQL